MKTWFISDLHLDESRPHIIQLFLNFLDEITPQAHALYILGDFFEYWIGDDALDHPSTSHLSAVIHKLKTLSDSGIPIYLIVGNRDFLLSDHFTERTGCQILADETVIDLYGKQTLIMHGDTLCTDDVEYLKLRELLRSKTWQKDFLALSIEERLAQALELRKLSKTETASKREKILDVNQQAVEAVMRKHNVSELIHGHTHRMARHDFDLDGQTATRFVLGDWYEELRFLSVKPNKYHLV